MALPPPFVIRIALNSIEIKIATATTAPAKLSIAISSSWKFVNGFRIQVYAPAVPLRVSMPSDPAINSQAVETERVGADKVTLSVRTEKNNFASRSRQNREEFPFSIISAAQALPGRPSANFTDIQ